MLPSRAPSGLIEIEHQHIEHQYILVLIAIPHTRTRIVQADCNPQSDKPGLVETATTAKKVTTTRKQTAHHT
jgi:hypothetical protein